jgi:UDP-N-acetylglucosamine 2-epimerase
LAKKSIYVATIVGARPQFIKAAALSRAITRHNASLPESCIAEKIIHTGQHYDDNMSKVFFDELEIPRPDYNLCVGSGLHGEQTGQMLRLVEDVLVKEKPDMVLVYGDTNSTLAGALAATKLHIPVLHIEAGLRSFSRKMPEEINRVLTDHISKLLFCPTKTAVDNLVAEGITQGIYEVGDVMCDSVVFYREKARSIESDLLASLDIEHKSYYLVTVHRAENTGDTQRLDNILKGLGEISSAEHPTVLPLHPRTKKTIVELGLTVPENIRIVEPVSYLEMIALENNAKAILTDSGGIQKEAYMLGVPCITLRDETEWIETVESGWNVLAGPDRAEIIEAVERADELRRAKRKPFYGDGRAGDKICDIIGRGVQ